jgi:hypothetical protein
MSADMVQMGDMVDEANILSTAKQAAALIASSASLVACGGGSSTSATVTMPVSVVPNNYYTKAQSNEAAARFLLQCQFSASDEDIAAVRATTFAAYLQQA